MHGVWRKCLCVLAPPGQQLSKGQRHHFRAHMTVVLCMFISPGSRRWCNHRGKSQQDRFTLSGQQLCRSGSSGTWRWLPPFMVLFGVGPLKNSLNCVYRLMKTLVAQSLVHSSQDTHLDGSVCLERQSIVGIVVHKFPLSTTNWWFYHFETSCQETPHYVTTTLLTQMHDVHVYLFFIDLYWIS